MKSRRIKEAVKGCNITTGGDGGPVGTDSASGASSSGSDSSGCGSPGEVNSAEMEPGNEGIHIKLE